MRDEGDELALRLDFFAGQGNVQPALSIHRVAQRASHLGLSHTPAQLPTSRD